MNGFDEQYAIRALRDAGSDGPPIDGITRAALANGRAAVRRRRLAGLSAVAASGLAIAAALSVQAVQPVAEPTPATGGTVTPGPNEWCPITVVDEGPPVTYELSPTPAPALDVSPTPDSVPTYDYGWAARTIESDLTPESIQDEHREIYQGYVDIIGADWVDGHDWSPGVTGLRVLDPAASAADGLPEGWGATALLTVHRDGYAQTIFSCSDTPDEDRGVVYRREITTDGGDVVTIVYEVRDHGPAGLQHRLEAYRIVESDSDHWWNIAASISTPRMVGSTDPEAEIDEEAVTAWIESYTDQLVQVVSAPPES